MVISDGCHSKSSTSSSELNTLKLKEHTNSVNFNIEEILSIYFIAYLTLCCTLIVTNGNRCRSKTVDIGRSENTILKMRFVGSCLCHTLVIYKLTPLKLIKILKDFRTFVSISNKTWTQGLRTKRQSSMSRRAGTEEHDVDMAGFLHVLKMIRRPPCTTSLK